MRLRDYACRFLYPQPLHPVQEQLRGWCATNDAKRSFLIPYIRIIIRLCGGIFHRLYASFLYVRICFYKEKDPMEIAIVDIWSSSKEKTDENEEGCEKIRSIDFWSVGVFASNVWKILFFFFVKVYKMNGLQSKFILFFSSTVKDQHPVFDILSPKRWEVGEKQHSLEHEKSRFGSIHKRAGLIHAGGLHSIILDRCPLIEAVPFLRSFSPSQSLLPGFQRHSRKAPQSRLQALSRLEEPWKSLLWNLTEIFPECCHSYTTAFPSSLSIQPAVCYRANYFDSHRRVATLK